MSKKSRVYVGVLALFIATSAFLVYGQMAPSPNTYELNVPLNLLVIAPHQDDGAIMAAGFAQRNVSIGGHNLVAYLTIRKGELELNPTHARMDK